MMHVKLDYNKIYNNMLARVQSFEEIDFEKVIPKVLDQCADAMLEAMQKEVKEHFRKGRAYRALKRGEVEQYGNYFCVKVGAYDIRGVDASGFHIVYHEHGSPGHTPRHRAGPNSRYRRKGGTAGVLKATPFLKKAEALGKKMVAELAGEMVASEVAKRG